jgi:hypothetical protein
VYFGFDKALLTTAARAKLKNGDDCLKKTSDPRTWRRSFALARQEWQRRK